MTALRAISLAGLLTASLPALASAEVELSFYSGWQTSPHSVVDGTRPDGTDFSETFGWEGRSLDPPPYYGMRGTFWRNENLGLGWEFTHAKTYGDAGDLAASGFERFEMTDGLNIVTLNAMHRWPERVGPVTPYVGGGLGVAIPHVDVLTDSGDKTFGYQVTGPAARVMAGASVDISENWALFGEYQGTYSSHNADLDPEGSFETDIITNAVNMGVSFSF